MDRTVETLESRSGVPADMMSRSGKDGAREREAGKVVKSTTGSLKMEDEHKRGQRPVLTVDNAFQDDKGAKGAGPRLAKDPRTRPSTWIPSRRGAHLGPDIPRRNPTHAVDSPRQSSMRLGVGWEADGPPVLSGSRIRTGTRQG